MGSRTRSGLERAIPNLRTSHSRDINACGGTRTGKAAAYAKGRKRTRESEKKSDEQK